MDINDADFKNVQRIMGAEFTNFLKQLVEEAEVLHRFIIARDADQQMESIKLHAHNLKSVGRQSGLQALGEHAAIIEKIAIHQVRGDESFDAAEWQKICDEFETIFERTKAEIHTRTGGAV